MERIKLSRCKDVFAIGMSYRLSRLFRVPIITSLLFFVTFILFVSKATLQPSSHNFPIDIREALSNAGSIFAVRPVIESSGNFGRRPVCVALIVLLSGNIMGLPVDCFVSERHVASCVRM